MKLNQILTISGKPGLYQLQSRTRTGFLALSLLDGKRISIGLRSNVSLLSEIAIYTLDRVYPSDIKKIIQWYNLLIDKGFLDSDEVTNN